MLRSHPHLPCSFTPLCLISLLRAVSWGVGGVSPVPPCHTDGGVWGAEGQAQPLLGPEYRQMGSAILSSILFQDTSVGAMPAGRGTLGSPGAGDGSSLPGHAAPPARSKAALPALFRGFTQRQRRNINCPLLNKSLVSRLPQTLCRRRHLHKGDQLAGAQGPTVGCQHIKPGFFYGQHFAPLSPPAAHLDLQDEGRRLVIEKERRLCCVTLLSGLAYVSGDGALLQILHSLELQIMHACVAGGT